MLAAVSAGQVQLFRVPRAEAVITLIVLSMMTPLAPLAIFDIGLPGIMFFGIVAWFWWTVLVRIPVRVEVHDDGWILLAAKLRQRRLHVSAVTSLALNRGGQITMRSTNGTTLIKVIDGHQLVDLLLQMRSNLAHVDLHEQGPFHTPPGPALTLSSRSRHELLMRTRSVTFRQLFAEAPRWCRWSLVAGIAVSAGSLLAGAVAGSVAGQEPAWWGPGYAGACALCLPAALRLNSLRRNWHAS